MNLYSMMAAVAAAGGAMLASPAESQAHNRGTPFGINIGVGNLQFSYGSGFGHGSGFGRDGGFYGNSFGSGRSFGAVPAYGYSPQAIHGFRPSYVAPRQFAPARGIYPQPYHGARQGYISPRHMYQAPRGPYWR